MVDNLIKGALLGVFGFIWWWVGTSMPWVMDGSMGTMSSSYMFYSIVAFALLASGK